MVSEDKDLRNVSLLINKDNVQNTFLEFDSVPELQTDQILVEISFFSVTANNATYVALGKQYQYWDFFPTKTNYGQMPVWGFGTVLKTKNASITLNERIFGYFPASKYIILCPVKVNYSNFMVSRPQVPVDRVVYNTYVRVKNNLAFQKNEEGISIFWPLWATAYNLVYMLNANKNWFAKNIIVTSASSKTSFCFAKEFGRRNNGTRLIGLTSKANVDFVKSLKLYDVVLTYDNYKNLETDMKSLIVDVAGDRLLNSNLAKHLGDNRVQTVTVGMSHYEPNEKSLDARPAEETSRNRTSLFFAPVWILKRRDELGKEKAQELEEIAWNDTVQHLHNWIKFSKFKGPLTTEIVYQKAIAGKLDAKVGYIVSML